MRREEIDRLFGVTDRQLDSMAEEYENGTWKGRVGTVRPGRPRVFDEELETISFRIPKSRVQEIDRSARERGESRSQFLRRTIDQALPA
jgi:hypothetical protein